MGPLVTAGHRDRVRGYVDGGLAEGAELVVDGRAATVPDAGFFLGPCLFDRVTPSMALYRDEIFGPVLSVVRVETYDEAVRLVSENPYGNGVAIFTRDGGAARRFEHEVDAGMVGVNVPIPVPMAYYSFGGWKQSLFGDTHVHGPEGVHFYTRQGGHEPLVRSRVGPRRPRPRPRLPPFLRISVGRSIDRDQVVADGGLSKISVGRSIDRDQVVADGGSRRSSPRGDFGHELGDGVGLPEVGELDDEALDAGGGFCGECVGHLARTAGDEATPAAEPSLGERHGLVALGGSGREPDRVLHRDPGVAREGPQLGEAVDRVGRAVPPVGVVAHDRHGELRPGTADVQRRAWQLPGTGPADRAVQLMDRAIVIEGLPANIRSRISIVSRMRAARCGGPAPIP